MLFLQISPAVCLARPQTTFANVDFPIPFFPTIPIIFPLSKPKRSILKIVRSLLLYSKSFISSSNAFPDESLFTAESFLSTLNKWLTKLLFSISVCFSEAESSIADFSFHTLPEKSVCLSPVLHLSSSDKF